MTDLTGARGPRRPLDLTGLDAAITTGRRRLRRRRVSAGAAACVTLLAPALALVAADDRPSVTPAAPTREPERPPRDGRAWIGDSPADAEVVASQDPAACTSDDTVDGFCSNAEAPDTIVPGSTMTLGFRVCRAATAGPGRLSFTPGESLSVIVTEITSAGEGLGWSWPYDDDPTAFTRTFAPGDCLTWRASWRGQAHDGYALNAGPAAVIAQFSREADRGDVPPPPAQLDVVVAPAAPPATR